jgi:hypothetical protein
MRPVLILIALAIATVCSRTPAPPAPKPIVPPPTYSPATFRADISKFVTAKDYASAVLLVQAANVSQQLAQDGSGYIAIGEYTIFLPGVDSQVQYKRSRDWYVPGTQDAIEDEAWQTTATNFAEQYNLARLAQVQVKP